MPVDNYEVNNKHQLPTKKRAKALQAAPKTQNNN
jgi:hypothetical protein